MARKTTDDLQVASHASNSTDIPTVDDKLESFQTTHGLLASVHAAISGDNLDKLTGVPPPDRRLSEEASSTAADCCHTMARVENSYLKSQSFLSVKLLGTGGFSTVDEVVHRETKLRISRKTLKNREHSALEELKKEVNVLQKLRHPHIIRYLGAYTKDDKVSILLSPVAETNLAVWLEKCYLEKPAGLADTVMKMFGCLASSIRYLHEQRPVIKHMDIKPQNILVMHGSHDMPHVVLSDFGISSAEASTTAQNPTPLTRQYCAPEVPSRTSRGQAADIWSLGCVFLEMLAAAYHDTNGQWLDFRKEFSGRKGKYYWEEVPRLHDWISSFLDQAANYTEATVLRTVKSMVREEPVERPSAAMLTILFAPAPCCLSWPNEKASFPAPHEEFELAERLLREDGVAGQDRAQAPGVERPALLGGQDEHESFEIAKTWLRDCSKNHETCRPEASTAKVLPTRLIDIRPIGLTRSSVRLLNSSELPLESCPAEYAAISHIWTDQDLTLSTQRLQSMQDNLPREELPKALNDAIAVADRIGHRYIWVDSLCVIQDSAEDKRRECAMMASTYRNAVLTIVADATDTSSAVRQTSLPVIFPIDWEAPGFAWDTRPWCLQERLLCGRLLHLTSGQMYWDCHSLKASETFRRGLPSLVWEKVHTRSSIGRSAPLSSRRSPAEAPAIIRDCQFLRKEGDGISDAMSAQMQMALKAHPTSSSRKLEHPTLVASPVDELQPDFGVSAPPDSSFASAANVFDLDQVQETVKEKEKQKEKQKQKQKIIEEEKVDCLCGGAHRPKRSKGSLPVVDDRCGSRQMCTGMRPPCGLL
jgi:serine/threonine protein kinase